MFGIDYKITKLEIEHRRALLTLLKLEYGLFEPCYLKIPTLPPLPNKHAGNRNPSGASYFPSSSAIQSHPDSLHRKSSPPPFGIFSMIEDPQFNSSETLEGQQLKLEIYDDRDTLQLICYGQTSLKDDNWIHPKVRDAIYRNDSLVQCSNYMYLQALHTARVDLFHVSKGDFPLAAGYIEITIRIYSIDVSRCLKNGTKNESFIQNIERSSVSLWQTTEHQESTLNSLQMNDSMKLIINTLIDIKPSWMDAVPNNDHIATINSKIADEESTLAKCYLENNLFFQDSPVSAQLTPERLDIGMLEERFEDYEEPSEESLSNGYDSIDEFVQSIRQGTITLTPTKVPLEGMPPEIQISNSVSEKLTHSSSKKASKKQPTKKQSTGSSIYARVI
jgi:hypothetical protein